MRGLLCVTKLDFCSVLHQVNKCASCGTWRPEAGVSMVTLMLNSLLELRLLSRRLRFSASLPPLGSRLGG